MSKSAGFTLIELLVAMAILAILSAVAYPSYRDYVVRGHLAEGTSALATMRADMERHFQDNRSYATVGSFTTPCQVPEAQRRFGNFVLSCASVDAGTFVLRATGSGPVNGFVYTISHQDVRATTAVPSGWSTCASQWIMRKGQSCG